MSFLEDIKQFVKGGFRAVLDSREPQHPVTVNINHQGGGTTLVPMQTPAPAPDPDVYILPVQQTGLIPFARAVPFDLVFEPLDEQTRGYLDIEQPVVVWIYDPRDPEDAMVVLTELGQGLSAKLYPGEYGLVALVYADESLDDLDAIGFGEFSIEEGEPPFELPVWITSDEDMIAELLGPETVIVGNRRSHVYHFSYCPAVYSMSTDNCVLFSSPEAAEEEGYDPCAQCVGEDYDD